MQPDIPSTLLPAWLRLTRLGSFAFSALLCSCAVLAALFFGADSPMFWPLIASGFIAGVALYLVRAARLRELDFALMAGDHMEIEAWYERQRRHPSLAFRIARGRAARQARADRRSAAPDPQPEPMRHAPTAFTVVRAPAQQKTALVRVLSAPSNQLLTLVDYLAALPPVPDHLTICDVAAASDGGSLGIEAEGADGSAIHLRLNGSLRSPKTGRARFLVNERVIPKGTKVEAEWLERMRNARYEPKLTRPGSNQVAPRQLFSQSELDRIIHQMAGCVETFVERVESERK